MSSLQGQLLAASPHMLDPNFARSVVLIVQHDEQGAFGVVLNRPGRHTAAEIWDQVSDEPCASTQRIDLGGPIEGPLMAIHVHELFSQCQILPGVHFSADRDAVEQVVRLADAPHRLFAGYAGWGEGQLESELEQGAWLTAPAQFDLIFQPADNLWQQVAKQIADDVIFSSLRIKHRPDDPSLN